MTDDSQDVHRLQNTILPESSDSSKGLNGSQDYKPFQLEEDVYLGELLDKQQSGTLTDSERHELQALMQTYQEGLLRKATACSEAVRRGLIEPLGDCE